MRDYAESIQFYCQKLHFRLVEDTCPPAQDKRRVVVAPPGSAGTSLLLARAATPEQAAFIGNQSGGGVFLFLQADDFWRDDYAMGAAGVHFVREPKSESYGTVAVFADLYGNVCDVEMEAGETLPRACTRQELLGYWEVCRERCQQTILTLTREQADRLCRFPWGEVTFAGLLVYTLRHVQEHAAQLRMFLGQKW